MNQGLKQLFIACICMFLHIFFKDKLDFFWVTSDEFCNEKSLLYKIFYYMISAGLVIRAKYYTGFKLAESSVIFCGLSYDNNLNNDNNNDIEIKHDFSKIQNVKITYFEFNIDPTDKLNYWNRSVHLWLKYQIYFRLVNLKHKF